MDTSIPTPVRLTDLRSAEMAEEQETRLAPECVWLASRRSAETPEEREVRLNLQVNQQQRLLENEL